MIANNEVPCIKENFVETHVRFVCTYVNDIVQVTPVYSSRITRQQEI